jgi:hypothetical protein
MMTVTDRPYRCGETIPREAGCAAGTMCKGLRTASQAFQHRAQANCLKKDGRKVGWWCVWLGLSLRERSDALARGFW